MWHTCVRCDVLGTSTKLTVATTIKGWSATVYVPQKYRFPANSLVRLDLDTKKTSKSGAKYWKASQASPKLDANFLQALSPEPLGTLPADERVALATALVRIDHYSWRHTFVTKLLNIAGPGPVQELFAYHLTQLGVTQNAKEIAQLLDVSHDVPFRLVTLADQWTARPFSPYLKGLMRHVAFGDPAERKRCDVHIRLRQQEQAGFSWVEESDLEGIGVLDDYEPLPACLVTDLDPTDLICVGLTTVQHTHIFRAEHALRRAWTRNNATLTVWEPHIATQSAKTAQYAALALCCCTRVSAVAGGPGVGKSWTLKQLVRVALHNGAAVRVVSSYHQPLKQLQRESYPPEVTFHTIASLIRTPLAEEQNGLVIVEEAGVCTLVDLARVFDQAGDSRVVLFGDPDQLKPIGIGQPYRDFLDLFPTATTRLIQNMRTINTALVANLGHVLAGRSVLDLTTTFVWHRTAPAVAELDLKGFDVQHDVVLVPTNKLRLQLNTLLHAQFLGRPVPAAPFVIGTHVICTKTTPCRTVTNGERGIVSRRSGKSLTLKLSSGETFSGDADYFDLAYALTAHKAQGSEFRRVFVYVPHTGFVTRNWLYTAFSRAQESVVYYATPTTHQAVVGRASLPYRCRLPRLVTGDVGDDEADSDSHDHDKE